ncbi:hypothetical protein BC834DRAFT_293174 [Gloeopeniophorella convolvens]|nr:hypothetical protein BC834DRAFT_293174 [Gloeopeniophorella convolvens]
MACIMLSAKILTGTSALQSCVTDNGHWLGDYHGRFVHRYLSCMDICTCFVAKQYRWTVLYCCPIMLSITLVFEKEKENAAIKSSVADFLMSRENVEKLSRVRVTCIFDDEWCASISVLTLRTTKCQQRCRRGT